MSTSPRSNAKTAKLGEPLKRVSKLNFFTTTNRKKMISKERYHAHAPKLDLGQMGKGWAW